MHRPGDGFMGKKGVFLMPTIQRKSWPIWALFIGVLSGAIGLGPLGSKARAQEGITNIEELKLEDLLVITATLHEQSVLDAPAAITVVTAADIKVRGYRSMPQIFADVVGFNEL